MAVESGSGSTNDGFVDVCKFITFTSCYTPLDVHHPLHLSASKKGVRNGSFWIRTG